MQQFEAVATQVVSADRLLAMYVGDTVLLRRLMDMAGITQRHKREVFSTMKRCVIPMGRFHELLSPGLFFALRFHNLYS